MSGMINYKDRVFSSAAIGFQSFLFVLTIYRFIEDLRSGWTRIPLANLVVRDGTWVFLLFLCKSTSHPYARSNACWMLFKPYKLQFTILLEIYTGAFSFREYFILYLGVPFTWTRKLICSCSWIWTISAFCVSFHIHPCLLLPHAYKWTTGVSNAS